MLVFGYYNHYGGLYFDTDVEVIKPMDNIIAKGPFMGCENEYDSLKIKEGAMALGVAPGLWSWCNSWSRSI